MRGTTVAVLLTVAIIVGAGAGYLFGNANEHALVMRPVSYQVIDPEITVRGQAAGFPCAALQFSCVTSANQSISATLIRYNGTYYYLSYYGSFNKLNATETMADGVLSNTWYTIWYDNSTVYCVSPKVQSSVICPA